MEKEIWKDIKGFEGYYQISNYGRIKTFYLAKEFGTIRKNTQDRLGYLWVGLRKPGMKSPTHSLIHRLVALHFVPNPDPDNLREINHKDGNKENNYFENLEWCTRSYNVQHAFDNGLKANKKGPCHPLSKRFYQFDLQGNFLAEWVGTNYCAKILHNLNPNLGRVSVIRDDISACLNGKSKTCCGFIFSFEPTVNAADHQPIRHLKPVIGTHKKTGEEIFFNKLTDTEGYVTENGQKVSATLVAKCCLGKRPSHAGYYWRYAND